jgi:hypothetical protein
MTGGKRAAAASSSKGGAEEKYADLLEPLLARDGALSGPAAVAPLVKDVLPRLPTATSRALACIVLQLSSVEVMHAFSASDGPELLADWLREALDRAPGAAPAAAADGAAPPSQPPYSPAEAKRAEEMVLAALKAVLPMPVTRPMLVASRLPKAIGALHKRHPAEAVRRAAAGVRQAWKDALQAAGGSSGGGGGAGAGGGSATAGGSGGGNSAGATSARCVQVGSLAFCFATAYEPLPHSTQPNKQQQLSTNKTGLRRRHRHQQRPR